MTYKKGKEKLWKWTFRITDLKGTFLGTRSDFDDWCLECQDNFGQVVWGIKIHDMTEEDYKDYLFWHAE